MCHGVLEYRDISSHQLCTRKRKAKGEVEGESDVQKAESEDDGEREDSGDSMGNRGSEGGGEVGEEREGVVEERGRKSVMWEANIQTVETPAFGSPHQSPNL